MILVEVCYIFLYSDLEYYLCVIVDYYLLDVFNGEVIDYVIESFIFIIVLMGKFDVDICNWVLVKDVVDYIFKENVQVFDYLMRLLFCLEKNKGIEVIVVDFKR